MRFIRNLIALVALLTVQVGFSQERRDKGEFIKAENKFYDEIFKECGTFQCSFRSGKTAGF
ncbi:MAG: hypothetical protein IPP71_12195 [Bacteroidetes bacterium]|nr:hypothetical protein [Bacteroidota bacterium]